MSISDGKDQQGDMKDRVLCYDIAKGIGIILVIICHIESIPLGIRSYLVTFHMPVFFVISGMLMHLTHEAKRPAKELILRKLKHILLPYFIFSLLFPFINIFYYNHIGIADPAALFRAEMIMGVTMTGISVLWFLPALFFSELIVLVLIKNTKRPAVELITVILTASLWPVTILVPIMSLVSRRVIFCSIFVLIGYLIYPAASFFRKRAAISFGISAALFIILYFTGRANDIVDLHYIKLGNIPLYFFNALIGSVALLLLSMVTEKTALPFLTVPLSFFGKHSLFIMITHINLYILYAGEKLAFYTSEMFPTAKGVILNLCAVFYTVLLEILLILLWEKVKAHGLKLFVSRNNP